MIVWGVQLKKNNDKDERETAQGDTESMLFIWKAHAEVAL